MNEDNNGFLFYLRRFPILGLILLVPMLPMLLLKIFGMQHLMVALLGISSSDHFQFSTAAVILPILAVVIPFLYFFKLYSFSALASYVLAGMRNEDITVVEALVGAGPLKPLKMELYSIPLLIFLLIVNIAMVSYRETRMSIPELKFVTEFGPGLVMAVIDSIIITFGIGMVDPRKTSSFLSSIGIKLLHVVLIFITMAIIVTVLSFISAGLSEMNSFKTTTQVAVYIYFFGQLWIYPIPIVLGVSLYLDSYREDVVLNHTNNN